MPWPCSRNWIPERASWASSTTERRAAFFPAHLPRGNKHPEALERLLIQPHARSFKAIAEQWSMRYVCIRTADEFDQLEALEKDAAILAELFRTGADGTGTERPTKVNELGATPALR